MTRLFGISNRGMLAIAGPMIFALSGAMAQVTATVHGKVLNAAGQPVTKGEVKFTTEKTVQPKDRKYAYAFPIDGTGNYKGEKIGPGDYTVIVFEDTKSLDFTDVVVKAGDDKTLDFDMSRAEYLKALSPEERAAIEDFKKKNASITAENSKIVNINAVLTQARADQKNGKAADAVKALTDLSVAKPDESVIWASLGEAQLAVADDAYKVAKTEKKPSGTPEIQQKYADSAASYKKAIDMNPTSKKPDPGLVSDSSMNMGKALILAGKPKDAVEAYDLSAKTVPAKAGAAYSNEAATFFNAQRSDEAAAAADKAIAADPKKALNYYIKGASLIGKATMDPKTQKFVAPAGCIEAYQEYLALEPTGQFSKDVTDLLTNLGQPVKSSFKAGKK